jgi:hypothetical protein
MNIKARYYLLARLSGCDQDTSSLVGSAAVKRRTLRRTKTKLAALTGSLHTSGIVTTFEAAKDLAWATYGAFP